MDAAYPSDLTDAEWEVLEPMMPKRQTQRGRPREVPFRQILNGLFYLNKEGCQWRAIPQKVWPVADDLPLFLALESQWSLASDQRQAGGQSAESGWARVPANSRDH